MKPKIMIGVFILISLIGALGLATAASALPSMDESDVTSVPNGYAEAMVRGSWVRLGYPYYSVQHVAKSHPSGLSGTAIFTGWNRSGGILYNVTTGFTGSYTYNPGLYNQIWCARTLVTVNGETAEAWIGPPGST